MSSCLVRSADLFTKYNSWIKLVSTSYSSYLSILTGYKFVYVYIDVAILDMSP